MNLYIINANDNLLTNFLLDDQYPNVFFTKRQGVPTTVEAEDMKFIQVSLSEILSNAKPDCHILFNSSLTEEDNAILNEVLKLTKNIMLTYDLKSAELQREMIVLAESTSENNNFRKLELMDLRTSWTQEGYLSQDINKQIKGSTKAIVLKPIMRLIDYPDENNFMFEVKAFWIHSNTGTQKPTGYLLRRNNQTNRLEVLSITTTSDLESARDTSYTLEQFCIASGGLDIMQMKFTASLYSLPEQRKQHTTGYGNIGRAPNTVTKDYRVKDGLYQTHMQQPLQQPLQQQMPQQNKVSEHLKPNSTKRRSAFDTIL